ncbi:hypothetical protein [Lysinibacillus xylanilyticus]|uniref:hypothetical protein n=1 Tax=Lysinibacillus xylanilyticus TaxID=582475 RepID=UPI0037F75CD3
MRESVVLTKRQQKGFILCESVVQRSDSNSTMLVTKALSQDVMVLAFVPILLIPKESPSLHSTCTFENIIPNFRGIV